MLVGGSSPDRKSLARLKKQTIEGAAGLEEGHYSRSSVKSGKKALEMEAEVVLFTLNYPSPRHCLSLPTRSLHYRQNITIIYHSEDKVL